MNRENGRMLSVSSVVVVLAVCAGVLSVAAPRSVSTGERPPTVIAASVMDGPGSLYLHIDDHGCLLGLGRPDGSTFIDRASLLLSHGLQDSDTTVYSHFGGYPSNGQNGFLSLTSLQIDTSAYHTGTGCAHAVASFCTPDSAIGVTIDWVLPQDLTLDEFVLARYNIYRQKPNIDVTNLTVGMLVRTDVTPKTSLGAVQHGLTNHADYDALRSLVSAAGVDTLGHVVSDGNTATRYCVGLRAVDDANGYYVADSDADLDPATGPTDGFLYRVMRQLEGFELATIEETDIYVLMGMDRERSIAVGETLSYTVAFISDTLSLPSFLSTADQAIAAAASLCMPCSCPCRHDPQCDGVTSDVLDVVSVVNVAFRGTASMPDPACPNERTDVDATGATDVTDVVKVVNVAFRGQSVAANYVDPCGP